MILPLEEHQIFFAESLHLIAGSLWALSPAIFAALGYTFATFFLKAALGRGARAGTVNAFSNLAMGIVAAPIVLLDKHVIPNPALLQGLVPAILFFLGQIFTFAALSRGDVSVATPVLGLKVLVVTALNAVIFSVPVPGRWWAAAGLASLGIILIAARPPKGKQREVLNAALFAFLAALAFSLTDVLVQHWAGASDPFVFLPLMFASVATLSTLYYLVTEPQALRIRPAFAKALGTGALLLALQAALMFFALAWSGDATAVNVVYASRSLFTIAAAWALGKWFGLPEAMESRTVLIVRLVAAALLFAAIALVCL